MTKPKPNYSHLGDFFECRVGSYVREICPRNVSIKQAIDDSISLAEKLFKESTFCRPIPIRVSIESYPDVYVVVNHNTNSDDAVSELSNLILAAESDPIILARIAFRKYEQARIDLKASPGNQAISEVMFNARHDLGKLI